MYLFRTFVLWVISIFFVISVHAQKQKITGSVLNKNSKEPIKNANIAVPGKDKGTTTDSTGSFYLKVERNNIDSIKITHVGFKEKTVEVGQSNNFKVYLKPETQNLHAVNILSQTEKNPEKFDHISKIGVPSEDVPMSINKVSDKEMNKRQKTNVAEAVENVSGVRPMNRYGGFLTFRMRGFGDFLLMKDQVRDDRHNLSNSAPSSNLAGVKQIEVLKGPSSAMYGHSALGGVINIRRYQPSETFKANVSATYGSFNTQRLMVGAGGPVNEKMQYRADFGMTRTDGWRSYGKNTNKAYMAFRYKLSEKDELLLRVNANSDHHDTDAGLPLTESGDLAEGLNPSTRFDHPYSFLDYKHYGGQLQYKHHFSDHLTFTNRVSYSYDDILYSASEGLAYTANKDSIKRTFHLFFNHKTLPFQNQMEMSWETETGVIKHKFLGGYTFNYLDRKTYRGPSNTDDEYFRSMAIDQPENGRGFVNFTENIYDAKQEQVHGLYVQDWMEVRRRLKLMGSLRMDIFKGKYFIDSVNSERQVTNKGKRKLRHSNAFTFRGGAVYELASNTRFYGSYGTYFKPSRRIVQGRIFKPVTGDQSELGFRWKIPGRIQINVAGYYIRKQNMILRDSLENGQITFQQIGEARSLGGEVDLKAKLFKGMRLKANYSFNKAEFTEHKTDLVSKEGNRVSFAPKHMGNIWAEYNFYHGIFKNFEIAAGGRYVGHNFTADDNKYKLPAYALFNGLISYNYDQWSISLKVNNITDQLYFQDAILNNQVFPGPPRNFNLKLSRRF